MASAGFRVGFGLKALKNYPELIPLVSILGVACAGAASYSVYSLVQKTDVRINRRSELPPHERVNPEASQKLVTINQKYARIPELEKLRSEIGSYRA